MDGGAGSQPNEADILEAVLTQDVAFSPPPSRRQSAALGAPQDVPQPIPVVAESVTSEPSIDSLSQSSVSDDSWKAQYDSQVEQWRAQSAEARLKAERERERWEEIRAIEKQKKAVSEDPEWEKIGTKFSAGQTSQLPSSSSSSQDAEKRPLPPRKPDEQSVHSRQDTGDDSQKWEDVPSSLTSSFPSMTFPDALQEATTPGDTLATRSVTLSIFDSSLSTGTRVKAVLSSLTINLLLPFVNGVMLGFGEIFAKNVLLGWLGWKSTPPVASVGLRS